MTRLDNGQGHVLPYEFNENLPLHILMKIGGGGVLRVVLKKCLLATHCLLNFNLSGASFLQS